MNLYVWYEPSVREWRIAHRPTTDPSKPVLMLALPPDTPVVPIDWVLTSEVPILP